MIEILQLCAIDGHLLLLILEIFAVQNSVVGRAAPVSPGNWLEMGLGPHSRPPESESAFKKDPWVNPVHIKMQEVLL